jgi:hypothetical protein
MNPPVPPNRATGQLECADAGSRQAVDDWAQDDVPCANRPFSRVFIARTGSTMVSYLSRNAMPCPLLLASLRNSVKDTLP